MTDLPSPVARRLRALAISDTGFVFDPRTGHSYTANATALCLLEALQGGLSTEASAALLRERFDASDMEVEHDVTEFVRLLREQGLLPGGVDGGSGVHR
jgi:hypothetical protein